LRLKVSKVLNRFVTKKQKKGWFNGLVRLYHSLHVLYYLVQFVFSSVPTVFRAKE
jgi:hypothetical protein